MTELEDDVSCLLEEGEDSEPSLGSVDEAMWWVRGKSAGRLVHWERPRTRNWDRFPTRESSERGFGPALSLQVQGPSPPAQPGGFFFCL
jgi:hypothetical protein